MKINYRLEVEYQVFEESESTFFETKNYVFNSKNSLQNRKDAINSYANFNHIFELASKITDSIKLSVTEVVNTCKNGFKIPFMNIYYSKEEFTSQNQGAILFGGYLNDFSERITELETEQNLYKANKIPGLSTEILEDFSGRQFKVINNSPFIDEDFRRFKHNSKLKGASL